LMKHQRTMHSPQPVDQFLRLGSRYDTGYRHDQKKPSLALLYEMSMFFVWR
jgi:hypothetical protein